MFTKEYNFHGVAVVELEDIVKVMNPQLFKLCFAGGGAMATTAMHDFNVPGVTNKDGVIVVLKSMMNSLTEEQKTAILHHERAHVINGDVTLTAEEKIQAATRKKPKVTDNLEYELRADKAGAEATSPEVMISTLRALSDFQAEYIGLKAKWIKNFLFYISSLGSKGKRIKALKAMIV